MPLAEQALTPPPLRTIGHQPGAALTSIAIGRRLAGWQGYCCSSADRHAGGEQPRGNAAMKGRGVRLDDRDLKILAILQREGRITKAELAKRVNLSATPCWARLQRLEEAGVIESYGARIAFKHLTPHTYVFVTIELESHRAEDFQRFEEIVGGIPEIFECFAVGGGIDYVIKVMAHDVDSYQTLVDGLLSSDAGVKRYWTYFVTKPVKEEPPPLYAALQPPE
jgi:Lrp/AsnC family transcriptional regulator, regulator of ectoine-degradation genes